VLIIPVLDQEGNTLVFLLERREFPSGFFFEKKLDDSSRLDIDEMARVPYILPSLFPSW